MTDQEILEKYREVIDKNVSQLYEQLNIKDDFEKQRFLEAYENKFVKGFREGEQSGGKKMQVQIAQNMLKQGLSLQNISSATGLSVKDVKRIQEDTKKSRK